MCMLEHEKEVAIMNSVLAKWKSSNFLAVIVFLQFAAFVTVFFDVPVARQVFCFVYLTFVPGLVIIKLLRLNELSDLEQFLLSIGFSVAFLMLIGLVTNESLFALGFSRPLSLLPLMIIVNAFVLVGGFFACLRSEGVGFWKLKTMRGVLPFAVPLTVVPILSIVGAMWVNIYESNVILLLLLAVVPSVFVIGIICSKLLPSRFYALAVFVIAIALLFHSSLISQYWVPYGSDTSGEYLVFKTTQNNAYWGQSFANSNIARYNSMLSITILPTVYSVVMNLDATFVIKMLYPLLFAFVPLALYCLWRTSFGDKKAFAAAFLLMATNAFYGEMLGLARQMVAMLFFVLLLLVMLSDKMKPSSKVVSFMIFSFALVVSHYDLAEIFLFLILAVWVSSVAMKRFSRNLSVTMILSFFVIAFSWYLFASGSATFDSIVSTANHVLQQLGQFFNPSSRGTTVLIALGLESSPSILNSVSRVFAYLTELFTVVGFIGLIKGRKKRQLKIEYFVLTIMAMTLLAALVLVPGLAATMNMTRFYQVLLFFLAPLCILGIENFARLLFKRRVALGASILIVIVLVPYFLFQTNFMYEVTGSQSWSFPLSKYRMTNTYLRWNIGYFDESEIVGALWLSQNVNVESSKVYADASSVNVVLHGYAMILNTEVLSNVTVPSANATIYLNRANLVDEIGVVLDYFWNTTSISSTLNFANKVYSNGGCEIYETPGS
jgi:uncharacterized membrane protein